MNGETEMRAAVHAWIAEQRHIDPAEIHWVIPLKLRRELPAVRDMPGKDNDVLVMVRGELLGWYLRGPGKGKLPPVPPQARDPRIS
jgi:hypothetical protein